MATLRLKGRARSAWARIFCLFAACGASAGAIAQVELEAEVSAGISLTDNVALRTVDKRSATVYRVQPSLALTQSNRRLDSDVDIRLEGLYYGQQSTSEVFRTFNANVSAALDPENFFIDFGGSRSHVIVDPDGPIPRGNLWQTTNRTRQDGAYIGPNLQYPLGPNITAAASWRRSWWDYDFAFDPGEALPFRNDFHSDYTNVSIDNYRRARGFTWAMRYDAQKTDYEGLPTWENRRATIELGAWVNESLRLFLAGGEESPWDEPFNPVLEDSFWEGGFARTVGDRLNLELAVGERSFGRSKRASVEATFQNGNTRFSYSEQPTTHRGDRFGRDFGRAVLGSAGTPLFDGFDFPGADAEALPEDLLTRVGLAERYLSERLAWSLSIERRRTQISVSVYDDKRSGRIALTGMPLRDERQTSGSVGVTREIGTRTSLSGYLRRTHRSYDGLTAPPDRELTDLSISADYEFGARTRVTLGYQRQVDDGAGGSRDYNLLALFLTRTFL